jgi:hypothetical protein
MSLQSTFAPTTRKARRPRRPLLHRLEQLEDRSVPATVNWDGGGGNLNWNTAANWDTNTLPGIGDLAVIGPAYSGTTITHSSGTTTVDAVLSYANLVLSGGSFTMVSFPGDSAFYGNFTQSGGTFSGDGHYYGTVDWTGGTAEVGSTCVHGTMNISGAAVVDSLWRLETESTGQINWTSGTISGTGTDPSLNVHGEFNISGSSDKRLNRVTLSNSGHITWTGSGDLVLDEDALLENWEDFEADTTGSLETRIIPSGNFDNYGTFRVHQTLRLGGGGVQFKNWDTVDLPIHTAALRIVGGEVSLYGGQVSGFGNLWVDGGTLQIDQPATLDGLQIDAGTLSVNYVLTAPFLDLAGGEVTGIADLIIPDEMSWSGGTLAGTGRLILASNSRLDLDAGTHWYGGRPIDLTAANSSVRWWAGTLRGDDPSRTLTLDGQLYILGDTAKSLREMTLVQNGPTMWDGAGNLQLDEGAEFVNASDAVFDAINDTDVSLLSIRTPRGTFTNQGTFRKTGNGTLRVGAGNLLFENSGTLETPTGTFQLDGGRLNLNDGTTVTPDSQLRVNGGTLAVNTELDIANLRVDGGTLTVLAELTAPGLNLAGGTINGPADLVIPADSSMQWTGGSLSGAGQTRFEAGAALNLPGGTLGIPTYDSRPIVLDGTAAVNWTSGLITGAPLTLDGRLNISGTANKGLRTMTLIQNGRTYWSGTGNLVLDEGAAFHNQGLFEVQNDQFLQTVRAPVGTFRNTGIFRKTGTNTGTTTIGTGGLLFDNPGTLEIQAGTVHFTGPGARATFINTGTVDIQTGTLTTAGNYTQSAGQTIVRGTLRPSGTADIRGGTLGGTGTVQARVTNSGRLAPGLSPGVLTINGNYIQSAQGELVLEVNGYGTGVGHDQLRVNGTVSLGGKLTLLGEFLPTAGDFFTLLDNDLADGVTGALSGLAEGASLDSNGRNFRISYLGGNGHDNDLVAFFAGTAPVLAPIGNQTIDEGGTLSFTATATDADVPAQVFTYSLVGAPDGATIDPTTGVFTWTPTEEQGPGTFTFTVRVTDNGAPNLSDEESITVTVNEVNAAPELGPLFGDHEVDEGSTLTFTATATDPDLPANSLTFSLDGAPFGPTIDPATGVFSWTPTEDDGPGIYTFRVLVTDDGAPALSDEWTITVTVHEADHVRPSAAVTGPTDGVRNQPRRFVLTADDADPADRAAGFQFGIDWGDGSDKQVIDPTPGNGAGVPLSHVYLEEGEFTVRVTATDQNGAVSNEATHTITITRAALQDDPLAPGGLMLVVGGGSEDDVIRLSAGAARGSVVVRLNGVREGVYQPTSRVLAFGGDGNDRINILSAVKLPSWVFGGLGDDDLFAGGAPAVLLGGEGADDLAGRAGRDLLIGGAGADALSGRGGDDLMIDGTTIFDADEPTLAAIQAAWLAADDYPTRVANLRDSFLFTEDPNHTVLDDGVADFLNGNAGRDLFFANLDVGVLDLIFRPTATEDQFDVD